MGLFGGLFRIVGFLTLVLIGLGAYLYFVDYTVEATITEKGQDNAGNYVLVAPNVYPGYQIRQDLEPEAAQFVCSGYKVNYRIQSTYTEVYDRQNRLVWDSENGVNDALRTALTTC